jgi:hypothetical protein
MGAVERGPPVLFRDAQGPDLGPTQRVQVARRAEGDHRGAGASRVQETVNGCDLHRVPV